MVHDKDVQAFLAFLAAQAEATGYVVVTEDMTCALDTAAWKLDQQKDPELYAAYLADKRYRYTRCYARC